MPLTDAHNRELLTIRQACARAGVSRRTIYNWIDKGKLSYAMVPSGAKRIYADELVRPQQQPPTPGAGRED